MLRRIVLMLALLVLVSSFQDISYADRHFVQVGKNMYAELSLDINSVQVIRNAPPFYVVRADDKMTNYDTKSEAIMTKEYFYDYSTKKISLRYLFGVSKDSKGNRGVYTFRESDPKGRIREVKPETTDEIMARRVFKVAFNKKFK